MKAHPTPGSVSSSLEEASGFFQALDSALLMRGIDHQRCALATPITTVAGATA